MNGLTVCMCFTTSKEALVVKNIPVNAEDIREAGLIPGLGRFLGG